MSRAATYEEPHWYTGKMKIRCSSCGKVAYADEDTAKGRATQISERQPMRAYKGRCGWWHVTRVRAGRRG